MERRHSLHYRRLWQVVAWALLALVVWLSLTPSPPHPPVLVWDKAQHALAYAVLAGWFMQAWERRANIPWAIVLLGIGIALEYIQGLTGYRDFDYGDMLANGVGISVALAVTYTVLGRTLEWIDRLIAGRGN